MTARPYWVVWLYYYILNGILTVRPRDGLGDKGVRRKQMSCCNRKDRCTYTTLKGGPLPNGEHCGKEFEKVYRIVVVRH